MKDEEKYRDQLEYEKFLEKQREDEYIKELYDKEVISKVELDLFGNAIEDDENSLSEHWQNMPEYNNVRQSDPFITATFKFRTQEDFDEFNDKVKKFLYNNERVFDGMQSKTKKSTWFPLKIKGSKYGVY